MTAFAANGENVLIEELERGDGAQELHIPAHAHSRLGPEGGSGRVALPHALQHRTRTAHHLVALGAGHACHALPIRGGVERPARRLPPSTPPSIRTSCKTCSLASTGPIKPAAAGWR